MTWYRVQFCECVICPEMTWCYWQDISIQELTKVADPWFNKQNLWEWGIWRWNFVLKKKEKKWPNNKRILQDQKDRMDRDLAPSWSKCWLNNFRNTHQPKAGIILCFTLKDKLILSHASSVLSLTSSILICLPTVFVLPAYAVICPQAEWTPEILPFPQHSAPPGRGPYFVSQSQQELETFFTLLADDPL